MTVSTNVSVSTPAHVVGVIDRTQAAPNWLDSLQKVTRRECVSTSQDCYYSRGDLTDTGQCPARTHLCCDKSDSTAAAAVTSAKGHADASDSQYTTLCQGTSCPSTDKALTAYELCRSTYPACRHNTCTSSGQTTPTPTTTRVTATRQRRTPSRTTEQLEKARRWATGSGLFVVLLVFLLLVVILAWLWNPRTVYVPVPPVAPPPLASSSSVSPTPSVSSTPSSPLH